MKIQNDEILLTGRWAEFDGKVAGDETCKRINDLVAYHLVELGRDQSGWDALYKDPDDGRLWELVYPESEMHGGGPPQLRCLTFEEARKKYGPIVN